MPVRKAPAPSTNRPARKAADAAGKALRSAAMVAALLGGGCVPQGGGGSAPSGTGVTEVDPNTAPIDLNAPSDHSFPIPLDVGPKSSVEFFYGEGGIETLQRMPTTGWLQTDDEGQVLIPAPTLAQLKARYPSFVLLVSDPHGPMLLFRINLVEGDLVTPIVNRPPVFVETSLSAALTEGVAASGKILTQDADADLVKVVPVGAVPEGFYMLADGSWSWTPRPGSAGHYSVRLRASDDHVTAEADMSLTVAFNPAVNHAPIPRPDDRWRAAARAKFAFPTDGHALSDPDGDPVSFWEAKGSGALGVLGYAAGAGSSVAYASGGSGSGRAAVILVDGRGGSAVRNLDVDFLAGYVRCFQVRGLAPVSFRLSDLEIPVPGAGPATVTLAAASESSAGRLGLAEGGVVTFTPTKAPSASGGFLVSSFDYSLTYGDGTKGVAKALFYSGTAAPATSSADLAVDQDAGTTASWPQPLIPGVGYVFELSVPPRAGAATLHPGGAVSYVPYRGFTGADAFTCVAVDEYGGCSSVAFNVQVKRVEYAPAFGAAPAPAAVTRGTTATGRVSATDRNGDALRYARNAPGTVLPSVYDGFTLSADGSWKFEAPAVLGRKTFDAYAINPSGLYAKTTLTFDVQRENSAPAVSDGGAAVAEGGVLQGFCVATDADGDPLAYSLAAGPAHGTATVAADGSFTYVPAAGYSGADSFSFKAADGYGGETTGKVAVTVKPAVVASVPATVAAGDPTDVSVHKSLEDDVAAARARAAQAAKDLAAEQAELAELAAQKAALEAQKAAAVAQLASVDARISNASALSNEAAAASLVDDAAAAQKAAEWDARYVRPTTAPAATPAARSVSTAASAEAFSARVAAAASPAPQEINPIGKKKVEDKAAELTAKVADLGVQISAKQAQLDAEQADYNRIFAQGQAAWQRYLSNKAAYDSSRSAYDGLRSQYLSWSSSYGAEIGAFPTVPDLSGWSVRTMPWDNLKTLMDAAAQSLNVSATRYANNTASYWIPTPTTPVSSANAMAPSLEKNYLPAEQDYLGGHVSVILRYSGAANADYPAFMFERIRRPDGSTYESPTSTANNPNDVLAVAPALSERAKLRLRAVKATEAALLAQSMRAKIDAMASAARYEQDNADYASAVAAYSALQPVITGLAADKATLESLRAAKAKAQADLARISDYLGQHGWYLDERGRITNDLLQKQADLAKKADEVAQKDAEVAVVAANKAAADKIAAELETRLPGAPADAISGRVLIGGEWFDVSYRTPDGGAVAPEALADKLKAVAKALTDAAESTEITFSNRGRVESFLLPVASREVKAWARFRVGGLAGRLPVRTFPTRQEAVAYLQSASDRISWTSCEYRDGGLNPGEEWREIAGGLFMKYWVEYSGPGKMLPAKVWAQVDTGNLATDDGIFLLPVMASESVEGAKAALESRALAIGSAEIEYAGGKFRVFESNGSYWGKYQVAPGGRWWTTPAWLSRDGLLAAMHAAIDAYRAKAAGGLSEPDYSAETSAARSMLPEFASATELRRHLAALENIGSLQKEILGDIISGYLAGDDLCQECFLPASLERAVTDALLSIKTEGMLNEAALLAQGVPQEIVDRLALVAYIASGATGSAQQSDIDFDVVSMAAPGLKLFGLGGKALVTCGGKTLAAFSFFAFREGAESLAARAEKLAAGEVLNLVDNGVAATLDDLAALSPRAYQKVINGSAKVLLENGLEVGFKRPKVLLHIKGTAEYLAAFASGEVKSYFIAATEKEVFALQAKILSKLTVAEAQNQAIIKLPIVVGLSREGAAASSSLIRTQYVEISKGANNLFHMYPVLKPIDDKFLEKVVDLTTRF